MDPSTISTTPASSVLDLPNGTYLVVREVGETLYLDAVNVGTGAAVAVALGEADESVLRAILDTRRERRAQLGSPGTVRP